MKLDMSKEEENGKVVRILVVCGKWTKGIEFPLEDLKDHDKSRNITFMIGGAIGSVVKAQKDEENGGEKDDRQDTVEG